MNDTIRRNLRDSQAKKTKIGSSKELLLAKEFGFNQTEFDEDIELESDNCAGRSTDHLIRINTLLEECLINPNVIMKNAAEIFDISEDLLKRKKDWPKIIGVSSEQETLVLVDGPDYNSYLIHIRKNILSNAKIIIENYDGIRYSLFQFLASCSIIDYPKTNESFGLQTIKLLISVYKANKPFEENIIKVLGDTIKPLLNVEDKNKLCHNILIGVLSLSWDRDLKKFLDKSIIHLFVGWIQQIIVEETPIKKALLLKKNEVTGEKAKADNIVNKNDPVIDFIRAFIQSKEFSEEFTTYISLVDLKDNPNQSQNLIYYKDFFEILNNSLETKNFKRSARLFTLIQLTFPKMNLEKEVAVLKAIFSFLETKFSKVTKSFKEFRKFNLSIKYLELIEKYEQFIWYNEEEANYFKEKIPPDEIKLIKVEYQRLLSSMIACYSEFFKFQDLIIIESKEALIFRLLKLLIDNSDPFVLTSMLQFLKGLITHFLLLPPDKSKTMHRSLEVIFVRTQDFIPLIQILEGGNRNEWVCRRSALYKKDVNLEKKDKQEEGRSLEKRKTVKSTTIKIQDNQAFNKKKETLLDINRDKMRLLGLMKTLSQLLFFIVSNTYHKDEPVKRLFQELISKYEKIYWKSYIFKTMETPNKDLQLLLMKTLFVLPSSSWVSQDIELLLEKFNIFRIGTLDGSDEMITFISLTLCRLVHYEHKEVSKINFDTLILNIFQLIESSLDRDYGSDKASNEKRFNLLLSCSLLLRVCSQKIAYKKFFQKSDDISYFSRVLKKEEMISIPLDSPIPIEDTWISDNLEYLLQSTSGQSKIKEHGQYAFRVLARIADIIQGKSLPPLPLIETLLKIEKDARDKVFEPSCTNAIFKNITNQYNKTLEDKISREKGEWNEDEIFLKGDENFHREHREQLMLYSNQSGMIRILIFLLGYHGNEEGNSNSTSTQKNHIKSNSRRDHIYSNRDISSLEQERQQFIENFEKFKNKVVKDLVPKHHHEASLKHINPVQQKSKSSSRCLDKDELSLFLQNQLEAGSAPELNPVDFFTKKNAAKKPIPKNFITLSISAALRSFYNSIRFAGSDFIRGILNQISNENILPCIARMIIKYKEEASDLPLKFFKFTNEYFRNHLFFEHISINNINNLKEVLDLINSIFYDLSRMKPKSKNLENNLTLLLEISEFHVLLVEILSNIDLIKEIYEKVGHGEKLPESKNNKLKEFIWMQFFPSDLIEMIIDILEKLMRKRLNNQKELILKIYQNFMEFFAFTMLISPKSKYEILNHFSKLEYLKERPFSSSYLQACLNQESMKGFKDNMEKFMRTKNLFIDTTQNANSEKAKNLKRLKINTIDFAEFFLAGKSIYEKRIVAFNNEGIYIFKNFTNLCKSCPLENMCPEPPALILRVAFSKLKFVSEIDCRSKFAIFIDKSDVMQPLILNFQTLKAASAFVRHCLFNDISLIKDPMFNQAIQTQLNSYQKQVSNQPEFLDWIDYRIKLDQSSKERPEIKKSFCIISSRDFFLFEVDFSKWFFYDETLNTYNKDFSDKERLELKIQNNIKKEKNIDELFKKNFIVFKLSEIKKKKFSYDGVLNCKLTLRKGLVLYLMLKDEQRFEELRLILEDEELEYKLKRGETLRIHPSFISSSPRRIKSIMPPDTEIFQRLTKINSALFHNN